MIRNYRFPFNIDLDAVFVSDCYFAYVYLNPVSPPFERLVPDVVTRILQHMQNLHSTVTSRLNSALQNGVDITSSTIISKINTITKDSYRYNSLYIGFAVHCIVRNAGIACTFNGSSHLSFTSSLITYRLSAIA